MDDSTHHMSEQLVPYLDGELTGAAREMVEQQLAADKKLRDELESLKITREAVMIYGLQQKVSGIHQQMMPELKTPLKKMNPLADGSVRRIIRYSIAVAASAVLIVGSIVGYNFYKLSSGKIFASHYRSYELGTVRDADSLLVSPVEKAYREKNYQKVTGLLSKKSSSTVKETFLAGLSYVELANNWDAIAMFNKVIAQNDSVQTNLFKDDAEYYLALTHIRNKDYDFAIDLLRRIKENPKHLYHEKVTAKLIRQVKLLKWR